MARVRTFVAAAGAVLAVGLAPVGAKADGVTLFNFTGKTTGAQPFGGVIFDADGNLYGSTNSGGAHQNVGTVWKLDPNGRETVLHSFSLCPASQRTCNEGDSPQGSLAIDANGNLVGTAASGGAPACVAGTVFAVAADGSETTLHSFCAKSRDGEHPRGGVVMDGSGNLFGITSDGGANGMGAAYALFAPDYTYQLIWSFCSQGSTRCTDGALPAPGDAPAPGLAIDGDGNLYGTASQGGAFDNGDVFRLSPSGSKYKLKVIYSFCKKGNCPDGAAPTSGLLLGIDGNLYGTTAQGGTGNKFQGESAGVVFQLVPNGDGSFSENVLYNFCSQAGCTDGAAPTGSLIMDSAGILYGTAAAGGAHKAGVVYALDPNSLNYAVYYDFCSQAKCADGQAPMVITNANGDLYGTTQKGGKQGKGTIFVLAGVANP